MRRTLATFCGLALLAVLPAGASAAAPTLGTLSATNLQGVSALLLGSANPQGSATTYRFEYVTEANFEVSGFSAALSTPTEAIGSGMSERPARAAISGLSPATSYRYRLIATNSTGPATSAPAAFATTQGFGLRPGTEGFSIRVPADGGAPAALAGSHPNQLAIHVGLNLGGEFEGQPGVPFPDGDLRDLRIELPDGFTANPAALPACHADDFHTPRDSPFEDSRSGESCPLGTQLGTAEVKTSLGGGVPRRFGLFNLDPPPGVPAQIGLSPFGSPVVFGVELRTQANGNYVMALVAEDLPQSIDMHALDIVLWGNPWGVSHNGERGNCLNETEPSFPWAKCSVGPPASFPPEAYLTMPASCTSPLDFELFASSYQQPQEASATATNRDEEGDPVGLDCSFLGFAPHPRGELTTANASTASGYQFTLTNEDDALIEPFTRVPSQVRKAVIRLPEGVTLNPSLGEGLGVCTPAQHAVETAFSPAGAGCPNASKIGEFTVKTPLFEEWLEGAIYLAQPNDPVIPGAENPFDTLVAVYLVAKSPSRGILVQLAGRIVPDPTTGRLTATFEGLPALPYDELDIDFRAGQRAPLISPPACGNHTTQIELAPWGGVVSVGAFPEASQIIAGIGGAACPAPGAPPFSPSAIAGGVNSNVGSYTPYFVHLTRTDAEQEITSYSLILPKGITGKLAGVPFCPEAAIAAARTKSGQSETANPSCPLASRVGRTLSGYGVGGALTYAPGRIYLAGPYRGSPLSLVTINSATVGPFDLGTIVIRSAFDVDPRTAQLQIDSRASDPIPHILGGIPLHLRDIRVYMDRPQFTRNPSSCEPSQMISTLTGAGARFDDPSDDSSATVAVRFQLLNCLTLGFKPKLGLRLRGGIHRGQHPQLRTTFAARGPRDANLKQIAVIMPHSLFLAQSHIRAVCTREQFDADRCPPGSVYGRAVAHTQLFDEPLRGDVYLRSSTRRLPDLVASLHSGAVEIVLEGKIGPAKSGIRAVFEELPDAPIERFVMTLFGGKRGLLENSANICAVPPVASVKALGQNNIGAIFQSTLRGQCGKRKANEGGRKR